MLSQDPNASFEELKTKLLGHIQSTFPITDRTGAFEVRVKDLEVTDTLGVDDIQGQLAARVEGRSWAAPVTGTVEIVDTTTGKVLVSKPGEQIARIPKLTRHYSYIVGGQEKFISHQWRLRPGPYVRETERAGEFKAQFQLAKGKSFNMMMDPASGYMHIDIGGRKVPAYSVLTAQGVSDAEMEKAWGKEIYSATKAKAKVDKDLRSFYQGWKGTALSDSADAPGAVRDLLATTKMDPLVALANVGKEVDTVDRDVLLGAATKLVDVSSGKRKADAIDSLKYKELWTSADQFAERLDRSQRDIAGRVRNALGNKKVQERLRAGSTGVVRDIVMPDLIQRPLFYAFTTSLAANGKQTNPLSMLADNSMTTIAGPGGIQNAHAISHSNTAIDPSHLGYLDPVFTPESNPGVNTHLSAGVKIKDRKPYIRLYNLKTGQMEDVDAARAATSHVVLPDQVKWSKGKPTPIRSQVRISDADGDIRDDVPFSKAHYVLPSSAQVFALETNLVPFMQNDSAGRTTMSARHMAQAISITGREAPMVQIDAGNGTTFETVIGSNFLAHKAPVDGVVKAVTKDHVLIEDKDGKTHSVHLYDHYPLNDAKAQLHSTATVKVGDRVPAGKLLADNNYTRGGELALGTNLRTAYIANGLNHEDGLVVSESAAAKMGSEHLYKPSMLVQESTVIGKKAFLLQKPTSYSSDALERIGDDGVVRVGATVRPGDPLVLALGSNDKPTSIGAETAQRMAAKVRSKYSNSAMVWDSDYEGEVVRVSRKGKTLVVHVKTKEPMQVGSKISTRHSAKGIVAAILPDNEMPHTADGKPMELLINPLGVPGRMNAGQILETNAGKIAEKTGKPYVVKNFDGGRDYLADLKADLKAHGISETETLYDPKTGRKLGDITVGPHYAFQLEHQIDKKTHYRSGGTAPKITGAPHLAYDNETQTPKGGGHHGAQSLGALGVYGALAEGLNDNLREMATLKSDKAQAEALWDALNSGDRLPPPKVPFVYRKFENLLMATGLDVQKTGTQTRLVPRTDAEIRAMSRGVIKDPHKTMRGKDDQPEKGGLFDPVITGGREGQHWGHIDLAEPMPNPMFEKSIAVTLGIRATDIPDIIAGKKTLPGGGIGGQGIRDALQKVDVATELEKVKTRLADPKVKGTELNDLNFKYKSLQALHVDGKKPHESWTLSAVPVLPPVYRPQGKLPDGTLKINPLNQLYRRLGTVNTSLLKGDKIPYNATLDAKLGLYQEIGNLFGTVPKGKKALDLDVRGTREDPNKQLPGILHMISGDQPKDGFFQDKMLGKKQDYTARATIVADPNLSVEEIGIPKKIAIELMRPMVAQRLIRAYGDPLKAHKMISEKHPVALKALAAEIEHRPILMKRDPVLHKYSIVGQKIVLTDSNAVKVSPLILPPVGGDIDGDAVALMVPITPEAVEEAKRTLPSNRQFNDSSGDVLYGPTNESALALHRMSVPRGEHKTAFKSAAEAEAAFIANKIDLNTKINVAGVGATTLGRTRIAAVVPEQYRHDVLTNLEKPFDRKYQTKVLSETAREAPKHFVQLADGVTRLGFRMAYESGHSVTLADLEPLREPRQKLIDATRKAVQGKSYDASTKQWIEATKDLHTIYSDHHKKNPTNVSDMATAGIKAKREQFQGLIMAPMLVEDHLGRPSKVPVTSSFSEGVDLGGYFLQASGARRGVIQKVDSVREPGYMSKLLIQNTIDQPITSHDCGATRGISMDVTERDVIDRYLSSPVTVGAKTYAAGTAVTPDMLRDLSKGRVAKIAVRSPLKCRAPQGVCSRCMGVHPNGKEYGLHEAAGIISAQALGERAAQIMLKQTHGGGIVSTHGGGVEKFTTVQRLFDASKPDATDAATAKKNGVVRSVSAARQGGWNIDIDGKLVHSRLKPLAHVKAGYTVTKGERLTDGDQNIHDLLKTQGIESVQRAMTQRIGDIYAGEGVLRRHAELVVRNVTGMARVDDPGDVAGYIRGDYVMSPVVDELNRGVATGGRPLKTTPVLKGITEVPAFRQTDWIARLQGERLRGHIMRAAQHGEISDYAKNNPIPGLARGADHGRRR